jgi:hypothetical protein
MNLDKKISTKKYISICVNFSNSLSGSLDNKHYKWKNCVTLNDKTEKKKTNYTKGSKIEKWQLKISSIEWKKKSQK